MRLKIKGFPLLVVIISFLSSMAQAMVFDMGQEKFGAYLRATDLPNWTNGTEPFAQSSGSNVSFNSQFTDLWSYEFGFLINNQSICWRLGLEVIQPSPLSGVTGSNSSGAALYSMNSQITVYTPKLGLEFKIQKWGQSRLWIYGEYGYATMTAQNSYNFTSTGTSTYNIPNFREVVTGTQTSLAASIGFETLMADTTTLSLEVGYRSLNFSALSMKTGVTNFQGAQAGGASALQNDNVTARDIDLSGPFAALNLRIWVY